MAFFSQYVLTAGLAASAMMSSGQTSLAQAKKQTVPANFQEPLRVIAHYDSVTGHHLTEMLEQAYPRYRQQVAQAQHKARSADGGDDVFVTHAERHAQNKTTATLDIGDGGIISADYVWPDGAAHIDFITGQNARYSVQDVTYMGDTASLTRTKTYQGKPDGRYRCVKETTEFSGQKNNQVVLVTATKQNDKTSIAVQYGAQSCHLVQNRVSTYANPDVFSMRPDSNQDFRQNLQALTGKAIRHFEPYLKAPR